MSKPTPIDEKMSWDESTTIKSKTDNKGIINYVNDVFVEVSEYSREELIGKPHNVVRHPDMPKVIFSYLWKNLLDGNNFNAVVKNLTKTGKYYWIVTNFDIFKTPSGQPSAFLGVRNGVPAKVIEIIEPLYKELLAIEQKSGMEESDAHLSEFLKDKGFDYNLYIKKLFAEIGVELGF